ncbi:conjugal transfer protein TraN [Erwinia sp. INIA-01]|uniref:conjugal transfer protein TraN n=1 Tax=Erwinia sp. INIA01 TaxID=2991500 RepID=UPI002225ACBC|nr:conjugal transfer protein TraN [Erwinia sp. INIA01]MCW1877172.1 conjugal transfer protein TraN [Erwinia sp. INIA01]
MKNVTRTLLQGMLLACASVSALAAPMDTANQEGVNAGKAASGTTTGDPNNYFENYSADAPQQSYYGGGTQTDTNMDVLGQKELSTSDLGQSARESYVNNPADNISADSDMIKLSDDIRSKAESLTGQQCVAQELSKTTWTTHSCEMATELKQTCTRRATIGTTGSRETYSTQLVLNAGDVSAKDLNDWWIQYDVTVPEDGTISSGRWELLQPSAPDYHGGGFNFSVRVLGQNVTTDLNRSGSLNISKQSVKKGQVISLQIRWNTSGNGGSYQNTLKTFLANGRYVLRATFPMEGVRDTVKATIDWTDSCPASMGDAVKLSEVCSEPGGNRSVTVGGAIYTLYSDCWGYTTTWSVYENDTNTCQALIKDRNCSEGTRTCTQKVGNLCVYQKMTYQCAHTEKSTGYLCGSEFYCSDGSCASMQAGQNQNFSEAVSQLAALAAAGKDFAGMDANSARAFTGKAMFCRQSAAGFSNCCKSGGWGQSAGLAHCNTEEKAIGQAKEKLLTVSVGTFCSKKVLGVCLQKKEGYCVFDNKIARIVQEQGRRDQLHVGFGSANSPDCRGIQVTELQTIKFDHIDFTDLYNELNSNVKLPDQNELNQRITSDIQNSLNTKGR